MKNALTAVLLASAALVVASCSPAAEDADPATATALESPEPSPSETPDASSAGPSASGSMQSVFDLEVGDCYDLPTGDNVDEVRAVDCDDPHDQEVIAIVQHPAGPNDDFPGAEELGDYADDECIDLFEDYVGVPYEESELLGFTLMPTAETWPVGDREIVCAVYLEDEQLEGSVAGTSR